MSIAQQLKVHRTKEPWQACPKIWRGGSLVQLALYCNVRAGSSLLWKNSLDENSEFRSRMEKKRYARKQESAGIKFDFTPFILCSERDTLDPNKSYFLIAMQLQWKRMSNVGNGLIRGFRQHIRCIFILSISNNTICSSSKDYFQQISC